MRVAASEPSPGDILDDPVELVILSLKQNAARCRVLANEQVVTLRAKRLWKVVPGQIARVITKKQWRYGAGLYVSGEIESTRLDARAAIPMPLKIADQGLWKPDEHYWRDPGDPIPAWARPIIAWGPRRSFEMEQILPGEDPFSDPIIESNDCKESGDFKEAYKILMDLCQADLRCLDAHAHLGNLSFDYRPADAIRHYEVGTKIGELSLGEHFDGLLPWACINNRPFLRCMNGFGLCLWRLNRFEEAERLFQRMLWLNPSDNQGVRFCLDDVRANRIWQDNERQA